MKVFFCFPMYSATFLLAKSRVGRLQTHRRGGAGSPQSGWRALFQSDAGSPDERLGAALVSLCRSLAGVCGAGDEVCEIAFKIMIENNGGIVLP